MARKITYNQDKVKELRMKVILDSLAVFSGTVKSEKEIATWSQFRKDLLMKYAPRVLPSINEHSGEDGQPLIIKFDKSFER